MKKKMLAIVLCALTCLSLLAACSSKDPTQRLQDYLDKNADEINQMMEGASSDEGEMKIYAKEGALYYDYTFKIELPFEVDMLKEQLDANKEDGRSTFNTVLEEMKKFGIDDPKVVVNYYTMDSELITSFVYENE